MSRFTIAANGLLCIVLIGLTGCNSRVRYENTFKLDPGSPSRNFSIDGPKKEQLVNIEVSAGEPITVDVVLAKDRDKSKSLLRASDVKSVSKSVTIPAGEPFIITVSLASPTKATEVSLRAKSAD